MKNILGLIIAFDTDNDLRELTEHRTVVRFRLAADIALLILSMLSNMVNSGIYRIGLLMKDKYHLIDHIGTGKDWDLSRKNAGITLLPPYSYSKAISVVTGETAVKLMPLQAPLIFCKRIVADYVVLADGDLIANIPMDEVVKAHEESGNDITMVVTKHAAENPFEYLL